MDTDGDGRINLEEFLTATSEMQMIHHQNNIWWAFNQLDTDGDGKITLEELQAALGDSKKSDASMVATLKELEGCVAEYDLDGDGAVSYEEFIRMLIPPDLDFKTIRFP
jgi:Ca2+-binding EF-hand superfamily protein